jgi:hypothetical protein
MKTCKYNSLALKLTALAGAVGITPAAHATIIESPTLPLSPPSDGPHNMNGTSTNFWDIDGSSSHGFYLTNYVQTGYKNAARFYASKSLHAAFVLSFGGSLADVRIGADIGKTLSNDLRFSNNIKITITSGGKNLQGNFTNNTPGYFGFDFRSGGKTNYGWGTFLITGTNGTTKSGEGFVIENAYYDDTGAAIAVGSVPEPSSIALLALGASGLAAWRLRRKAANKTTEAKAA